MMEITVRFGAGLANSLGSPRMQVALAEGAAVADLLDRLYAEFPQFNGLLNTTIAVVAGQAVDPAEPLSSGQEVSLLIPVSGGRF